MASNYLIESSLDRFNQLTFSNLLYKPCINHLEDVSMISETQMSKITSRMGMMHHVVAVVRIAAAIISL